MSKSARVMLILACVFVTLGLVCLFFEGYLVIAFEEYMRTGDVADLGDAIGKAIGGALIVLYIILIGIVTVTQAIAAIPFSAVLLKKVGPKWYAITLLSTAVLIAIVAIGLIAFTATSKSDASSSSSSMISNSSFYQQ